MVVGEVMKKSKYGKRKTLQTIGKKIILKQLKKDFQAGNLKASMSLMNTR